MKFLFDFLPIILFFVAYKLTDIFVATGVAIGSTLVLFAFLYFKGRKPGIMQWVSLAIIVIFGGAAIILHDPIYMIWKPTVLYVLMGSVLVGGELFFHKNLIALLMQKQMDSAGSAPIILPSFVWNRLNWAWVGFFIFMAVLNLYVGYNYAEKTWVNFKLFGGIGLMIVFIIFQSIYLSRYLQHDAPQHPKQPASTDELH